jgi:hypothetical protein
MIRSAEPLHLKITDVATHHVDGDVISYDVRIINAGSEAVRIPATTELHQLYTPEELTSRDFEFLSIYLTVLGADGKSRLLQASSRALYGRRDVPNSLLELKPGRWLTIKSEVSLGPQLIDKGGELQAHMIIEATRYRRTPAGLLVDSKPLKNLDSEKVALTH